MSYSTLYSNPTENRSIMVRALSSKMFTKNTCIFEAKFVSVNDGKTIGIKTYNPRKGFAAMKQFQPGEYYSLYNVDSKDFEEGYSCYSNCQHQVCHGAWYMQPRDDFQSYTEINCEFMFSQRVNRILENDGVIDMLGVYLEHGGGPTRGRIQGHFVKLQDARGQVFRVLVWFNPRCDNEDDFDLFNCDRGDICYIPMARRSERSDDNFTLTTLFHLVREPKFISDSMRQTLTLQHAYP